MRGGLDGREGSGCCGGEERRGERIRALERAFLQWDWSQTGA